MSSCLDYCSSLFTCLNQKSIDRLRTEQNSAARLSTRAKGCDQITPVLASLGWLPVCFIIDWIRLFITRLSISLASEIFWQRSFVYSRGPAVQGDQVSWAMIFLKHAFKGEPFLILIVFYFFKSVFYFSVFTFSLHCIWFLYPEFLLFWSVFF